MDESTRPVFYCCFKLFIDNKTSTEKGFKWNCDILGTPPKLKTQIKQMLFSQVRCCYFSTSILSLLPHVQTERGYVIGQSHNAVAPQITLKTWLPFFNEEKVHKVTLIRLCVRNHIKIAFL